MARMRAELKEYSPTTFARSTQAGISEISAASDLSDVLRASAVRQGALARDARRNLFVILGWGYVVAIANPIILHWARANEEFWGARWSAVALAFPFPYAQSLLVAVCSLVLTVLAFRTSGFTRITARESRWVIVAAWAGAICSGALLLVIVSWVVGFILLLVAVVCLTAFVMWLIFAAILDS